MTKGERIIVPEGRHSRRGASSSTRFIACPGSIQLTEKLIADGTIKPTTNRAAAEGTAAHLVHSSCLEDGTDAESMRGFEIEVADWVFVVDDEMIEGVQESIDWIRSRVSDAKAMGFEVDLYVEKSFTSFSDEDVYGTADVILHIIGWGLIVFDFKYGRGVTVEPVSDQNYYYSYLAAENLLPPDASDTIVESWISQPRIPHPEGTIRSHLTTVEEVTDWWYTTLLPSIVATREEEAELVLGEHCRFCPNKGHCPALKAEVFEFPMGIAPTHLTDTELGEVLQRLKAIDSVKSTFEQEALRRARNGDKLPGFKLVRKKANRAWKEKQAMKEANTGEMIQIEFEDAVIEEFGEEAYEPRKVRSPAQIEKLDGGKEFASTWAYKPDLGLTLAAESDKRPEVLSNMERLRGVARRH